MAVDAALPDASVRAEAAEDAALWRRRGWGSAVLFAAPALLELGLSLVGARHQLWRDEHATWWAAVLSWDDLRRLFGNVDVVFAPYYIFIHLWIKVFGDSEFALRVPSMLAMAAAAGVIGLLGRRLYDGWVGLTAGLLFAVLPGVSRYAQEARPYAFAMLFAVLATLLLLRALARPTWSRWLFYAGSVLLIGFGHLVALCVLLAHAVPVGRQAWAAGDRRVALQWAGAALLGLLPVLPLAYLGARQTGQLAWIRLDRHSLVGLAGDIVRSDVAAGVLIGLAALALTARPLDRRTALLAVWVAAPPLLLLVTFDLLGLFYYRYLLFTLPALVLSAALTVGWLTAGAGARRHAVVVGALTGALLLFAANDHAAVRQRVQPGEHDFRAAAAYVAAGRQPGDGIVYGGNQRRRERRAFAYELRDDTPPGDVLLTRQPAAVGDYVGAECQTGCAVSAERLWLVWTGTGTDPFAGMEPARAHLLRKDYRVVTTKRFARISVSLLLRKPR